MITYIIGTVTHKTNNRAVIEAGGIGYEVLIPFSSFEKLPSIGHEVKIYTYESVSMYAGSTTLYGFMSQDERDIFNLLKNEVPGAGAKKAMDYLDKITKSLPDFKRAVINKDSSMLTGVFGFRKKTADKLISSLKDKVGALKVEGKEKWSKDNLSSSRTQVISGLVSLGIREGVARQAVDMAISDIGENAEVKNLLKEALKNIKNG